MYLIIDLMFIFVHYLSLGNGKAVGRVEGNGF